MSNELPVPIPGERGRSTTLPLLVIVTGVLITAVDTTIVVLALPEMQRTLRVGVSGVVWVIIGYLLVLTVLATQVGRLGDMFGGRGCTRPALRCSCSARCCVRWRRARRR